MISGVLSHVKARLVAGLFLVLPLLITLWLLRLLFGIINQNLTPWVLLMLGARGASALGPVPVRIVAPLVGLTLTVASIYLIGLLAGNLAGRRVWELVEGGILRIPLVKRVYSSARQLLDAFSATSKGGFSKVVLVDYPRPGLRAVGFVTNEDLPALGSDAGAPRLVAVFLPTSPNPTSGFVVLVPTSELQVLDMTIEEGMKLVVSGGIVMPDHLRERAGSWTAS